MVNEEESSDKIVLLNKALARELQVSIQYMLQHATWYSQTSITPDKDATKKQGKFVSDHSMFRRPNSTLKLIAITEMKHAEAIAERIVCLKGNPTTEPDHIAIGITVKDILAMDKEAERGAITLYKHIIDVAAKDQDDVTRDLFKRILSDEERHHKTFSHMLEGK
jgi:bacterioferritin